jgi:hypothetical protein
MIPQMPLIAISWKRLRLEELSTDSSNSGLKIAQQLTKSVWSLFTLGLVHKTIRPESVLVFEQANDATQSLAALVGFMPDSRPSDGASPLIGDEPSLERDLYRHPDIQGHFRTVAYRSEHDIYSLGVCLLEIGLGLSLLSSKPVQKLIGRHHIDAHISGTAVQLKQFLYRFAEEELLFSMGTIYSDVVLSCLSCLGGDGQKGSASLEGQVDQDGIWIPSRFMEKVPDRLGGIRI